MRTITKVSSSSTISITLLKSRCTSLPDSENQRENNECELISSNRECAYLHARGLIHVDSREENHVTYLCDNRIESF